MNLVEMYQSVADSIGPETGASDTLLHVHAGMAVLLLARLITRRSLATWVPFSVVLAMALVNEAFDYVHRGQLLMPDSALDLINTVFWPLVLMLGLRLRRSREMRAARS